jgi:hypothetical protein
MQPLRSPLMSPPPGDPFYELAIEISDGERWKIMRAAGWEDFVERLAVTIADVSPRRRQALMMLLFLLMEGLVDPSEVQEWLRLNDATSEPGVETLITWLRQLRSRGEHLAG